MAEHRIIFGGLRDGIAQNSRERRRGGARGHDVFAADEFAGLLKNAAGLLLDQTVERAANAGIRRDAAGGVAAAADRADDEFIDVQRRAGNLRDLGEHVVHQLAALLDGFARAAVLLDDERFDRPAGSGDGFAQGIAVETFAAERKQNHAADVRMRAERAHHARRVIVRITAAEADEMHAAFAIRINNLARDVMRALDEIRDDDVVADAFAPVGAQVMPGQ